MAKRCPPGVICIENVTIIFVLIVVGFVVLFLKMQHQKQTAVRERVVIKEQGLQNPIQFPMNGHSDVLMDPYQAPLKDERTHVHPRNSSDPRGIPINTPTQSVDSTYRQVGILTRLNGDGENILPLMGRPLFTNRDKWNFYTMTDKNNMIKLPITHKGRSCTNEYGCDNMYNGDTVYVEGYNDAFKVTMYDNNTMRYIPYL
jgi:hypothetical protein